MRKALILVDLQNDYFPGGSMELSNIEKSAANAQLLLNRFREENGRIVHIQHISARPDATFFLPGTRGAEIHEMLAPHEGEHRMFTRRSWRRCPYPTPGYPPPRKS